MSSHVAFSPALIDIFGWQFRQLSRGHAPGKESAAQSKFNLQFCEARAGLRNFHFVRGENLIRIWRTQAFIFSHRIQ